MSRKKWKKLLSQMNPIMTILSDSADSFAIDCQHVSSCSLAPSPIIRVKPALWYAMIELCDKFSTEWLGYLLGECSTQTGEARVDGIYFPAQTATSVTVKNVTELTRIKPRTIGAIHSHVRMAAHWSGTDCEHANWPLEIVLNADGDYKANMLIALKCGSTMRKDAKVILTQERLVASLEDTLKDALAEGKAHEDANKLAVEQQTLVPAAYGAHGYPERWADSCTGRELCPFCYGDLPCPKHPVIAGPKPNGHADEDGFEGLLWQG